MIGRFFRWIFRYIVNLIIRIIVNYLIAIPIGFVVGVGIDFLAYNVIGKEFVFMDVVIHIYNIIFDSFLKWIPLVLAFFPNLLTLDDFKKGGGGCSNNYYWL